jgi:hypothetical protein
MGKQRKMKAAMSLILLAMTIGLGAVGSALGQGPAINRDGQQEEATFEEQLSNGLKVRTASEKAFIAKVVKTVQEGKLSESLVKAVFQRARAQHARYPLPYFTVMIRKLAKERGVAL